VKPSIIRVLLTLTATGAIVAGYGGMSTASAAPPSKPGRAPVLGKSSTPFSVSVTCGPNYESPQNCMPRRNNEGRSCAVTPGSRTRSTTCSRSVTR
jgi:hypothetical protein